MEKQTASMVSKLLVRLPCFVCAQRLSLTLSMFTQQNSLNLCIKEFIWLETKNVTLLWKEGEMRCGVKTKALSSTWEYKWV